MKRLSTYLVLLFLFSIIATTGATTSATADQCQEKACIAVFTDNDQIIIEARKGNKTVKKTIVQSAQKTKSKAKPKVSAKPTVVPLFFPPAATKPVVKKATVKRAYKARVKKAATRVNLSDRLTTMVPTAGVAYQPEFEPLTHVPVFFWCDLPTIFQSRVNIIGEVVDVALRPSFIWSFGDGSVFSTTENGAPYPNGVIQHAYSKPGNYVITLLTTWNGSYTHNAQVRAVSGTVKKFSIAAVTVVAAPTTFKG